jgi:SAM-dependent methyltransferase
MNVDPRSEIYRDLRRQQCGEEAKTHQSANRVLSIIKQYIEPRSVLDVGCGLGTWLQTARELGAGEVMGIEGPWLDRNAVVIDPGLIQTLDLAQPFNLGRRFDLVICIEVGEHLHATAASNFVGSLVAHGDCVLFSAAIPFQGGHDHVNEQFLDYWVKLFAKHGYRPLDIVRGHIWEDESMLWWLKQNCVLFCSERAIEANEKLKKERDVLRPMSVVHPRVYAHRLVQSNQWYKEYQEIMNLLRRGGKFKAQTQPNGSVTIERISTSAESE